MFYRHRNDILIYLILLLILCIFNLKFKLEYSKAFKVGGSLAKLGHELAKAAGEFRQLLRPKYDQHDHEDHYHVRDAEHGLGDRMAACWHHKERRSIVSNASLRCDIIETARFRRGPNESRTPRFIPCCSRVAGICRTRRHLRPQRPSHHRFGR